MSKNTKNCDLNLLIIDGKYMNRINIESSNVKKRAIFNLIPVLSIGCSSSENNLFLIYLFLLPLN